MMESERGKNEVELAIAELKRRIKNSEEDYSEDYLEDLFVLKWLRARGMDVDKAERMLKRSLQWRQEISWRQMKDEKLDPEIVGAMRYLTKSVAKTGEIVYFTKTNVPFRDLYKTFAHQLEIPHTRVLQLMAEVEADAVEMGKRVLNLQNNNSGICKDSVKGSILVMDGKDTSVWQMASIHFFQLLKQTAREFLTYMPSTGSTMIFINWPKLGMYLCNALKKVIDGPHYTVEAYDCNEERWKEALLRLIDADELPVQYGGNKIVQF